MAEPGNKLDPAVIGHLRKMARQGRTPSEMYRELTRTLTPAPDMPTVLGYFRKSFCLSLGDAKPIAALTRNERRGIENEELLDELLQAAIASHRSEWESLESAA